MSLLASAASTRVIMRSTIVMICSWVTPHPVGAENRVTSCALHVLAYGGGRADLAAAAHGCA